MKVTVLITIRYDTALLTAQHARSRVVDGQE